MDVFFELAAPAWVWLPLTTALTVLLLAVPLVGEKPRKTIALIFAIIGLAALAAGLAQAGEERTLDIVNPFPKPPDGAVDTSPLDVSRAPGWGWGLVAMLVTGSAALVVFLTRRKNPKAPSIIHPIAVTVWILLARLLFEASAAPAGLVWATGVTMTIPPVVFFVGIYSGRASQSFGRFMLNLLAVAVAGRLAITIASWFLTSNHMGTHLDVFPVTTLQDPILGEQRFENEMDAWFGAVAIAQMMFWTPFTVIVGAAIGGVGWMISHKKPPKSA